MSIYKEHDGTSMRDAALDRVLSNAPATWKALAMIKVLSLRGQEVTGEDIRLTCEREGIRPHHHNAWGAFISSLKRKGTLIGTGRYVNMRGAKSNARKTEVYRVR